jgi:putative ABC transport system permease protein
MPYTRFLDIKGATHSFSDYAAISEWRLAVGVKRDTRVRKVAGVSGSFFGLFDAQPAHGRFFGPAEDVRPIGAQVAVLSYGYWKSAFGGEDVIGKRLHIGMLDYTVIGVTPKGFVGAVSSGAQDIIVPITTIPANISRSTRDTYFSDYRWDWVDILVRRKPGVSVAVATADLTEAYRRSRAAQRVTTPTVLPDSIARPAGIFGAVKGAAGPDAGFESRVLFWVTGVAAIVLIIACANVANLMLARILRRRREIAVRLALGVSRTRLVGQFMTEGLLLAAIGGIVGLFVAQWGGVAIRRLLLPEGSTFTLGTDLRTISFVGLCVLATAILTVAGPAFLATRSDLARALKAGAREGGYRSSRLRSSLLVTQAALSVVLLVGAGLFVRSLNNVLAIPLGYDVTTVLDVNPDFRGEDPPDSAGQVAVRRRLLAAAQAIPGVDAAARANGTLFGTSTTGLHVAGIDSVERLGRFNFQVTTPDYFRVMRMRILRGRGFDRRDGEGTSPTTVVSNAMARALWPGKDPIGQCIQVIWN